MSYGPKGSGANSELVPPALSTFFGYSQDIKMEYQDDGSNAEWIEKLKQELDLRHPMVYGGYDDGMAGGHSFVCDGYDENDLFHFNWGWDGATTAFLPSARSTWVIMRSTPGAKRFSTAIPTATIFHAPAKSAGCKLLKMKPITA